MKRSAVIYTDGRLEFLHLPDDDYEELKHLIDGWLESPSILTPELQHCTLWLNEEGKIHELPENALATLVVGYWGLDTIRGNVVIQGPVNNHGNTTGLSDKDFDKIEKWCELGRARLAKFLTGFQT